MRSVFTATLVMGSFFVTQAAVSADPQHQPGYRAGADLKAELAQKTGDSVVSPLGIARPGQLAQVRRMVPGPAEYHTDKSHEHIWVILEGSAAITIGGELKDAKEVKPGDWYGSKIVGGRVIDAKPGDVVWIPVGAAHLVEPKGSVTYLNVNIDHAKP
jgi:mannose-6-phosphate isomerase-like protein (cupin superfamily)